MLNEIRTVAKQIEGYVCEEDSNDSSLKFIYKKAPSHDDQLKLERAGNIVRVTCFGSCDSQNHIVYVSF